MGRLADGMEKRPLIPHRDERGSFTEMFRESWGLGPHAIQWNLVRSAPKTVRGVHVHLIHLDYWMLVHGCATVGFRDLRVHSQTHGLSGEMRLTGDIPEILVIPPGVAHGFQFHDASIHLYAVTHYWDMTDELGCQWDDPNLGIAWPDKEAILSPRDRDAAPMGDLIVELKSHQARLYAPPLSR
jgi:dTDP-4-dehydrorhamnose 3,5-epimerase